MNISVIAFGTRGDVQPVLAVGKALQERGHRVRMIASANFKAWIESHGIETVAARIDIQAMMQGEGGSEWIEHGTDQIKQVRVMKKLLDQHGLAMMNDAWEACRDAQAVISSFTSDLYAVSIAEKLGARHISLPLQPALRATRSGMATMSAPLPRRYSLVNYLFGKLLMETFPWQLMGMSNNRFRQETLGLPPQTRLENAARLRRMCVVQGFSAHVVPHPRDWPASIYTAGYWFLDEDANWQPPQALLDFLAADEPPVYIGFGSMTGRDPQSLTRLIVEAVRQSEVRAVLQSGWAGIGEMELPASILRLGAAPHQRLFPLMGAAVHHGGSGTTAESLRAGLPTVIVPHMADQPFWGERVSALGVGPRPISRQQLTAEKLAAALRQAVGSADMRQRAAELGGKIRAEDGVANAVEWIEDFLNKSSTNQN